MIKVVVLGYGNVGFHLTTALSSAINVSVVQVYNRSVISSEDKSIFVSNLNELKDADVYIIALPDDIISAFSESLPFNDQLVVHTSGSLSIKELPSFNRRGVFYPLQSFSKNQEVSFNNIPICLEAESVSDMRILRDLGEAISTKVVEINSEERAKLHLAAVFVNNFVNYMYTVADDIISEGDLDVHLLEPLIKETANKIKHLSASEAQTGPAKRNDLKTIEKHLHLLRDSDHLGLYKELTKAIQNTYGKEL